MRRFDYKLNHDYLIVGSGAGGSAAFELLSQKGFDVLMLEEGSSQSKNYSKDISWGMQNLYRNSGLTPLLGFPLVAFGEGKLLGGTTELNGGLFWRTPSFILEDWKSRLDLPLLTSEHLWPHFDYLEEILQVSNQKRILGFDKDSDLLRVGAENLGWKVVDVPRLVPDCLRDNRCGSGCPTNKKNSMAQTFIPRGISKGGKVITDTRVLRIYKKGNRGVALKVKDLRTGVISYIGFKHLILAGGVFQTPNLLFRSRILRLTLLKTQFHVNTKIFATWEKEINADKGTIFTSQVQEFMQRGILFMPTNYRKEFLALAFGTKKSKLIEEMMGVYNKSGIFTAQIKVVSPAYIFSQKIPPFIFWKKSDIQLIKEANILLAKALFASGAKELQLSFSDSKFHDLASISEIIKESRFSDWNLQSVHAMATCAMGNHRKAIVNSEGKLRNCENIIVADASSLPTSIGESPQGTIMAMSRLIVSNYIHRKI
jgi:choline dehydrogenase-like flavoprotein